MNNKLHFAVYSLPSTQKSAVPLKHFILMWLIGSSDSFRFEPIRADSSRFNSNFTHTYDCQPFLHFSFFTFVIVLAVVHAVLQMPSSKPQSADDIIKKCHDVGGKLMQVGGGGGGTNNVEATTKNATQPHVTAAVNGAGRPVHYLHELPHAAEERYAELFKQLDRNGKWALGSKHWIDHVISFAVNTNTVTATGAHRWLSCDGDHSYTSLIEFRSSIYRQRSHRYTRFVGCPQRHWLFARICGDIFTANG